MGLYTSLKLAHVIGAAVLFGTGVGIAFFMLMAHRTRDAALVAHTAGMSLSPIRSLPQRQWCCSPQPGQHWQIWQGYRCLAAGSASASSCISSPGHVGFLLSGFNFGCGTSRGRRRVRMSLFPRAYHRLFRLWLVLGFPAFAAVVAIIWLMIAKPSL